MRFFSLCFGKKKTADVVNGFVSPQNSSPQNSSPQNSSPQSSSLPCVSKQSEDVPEIVIIDGDTKSEISDLSLFSSDSGYFDPMDSIDSLDTISSVLTEKSEEQHDHGLEIAQQFLDGILNPNKGTQSVDEEDGLSIIEIDNSSISSLSLK